MLVTGKDFAFEVSEQALVRLAMNHLRQNNVKITLRSVSEVSGLDVQQVKATMQQMVAERSAKEQGNGTVA